MDAVQRHNGENSITQNIAFYLVVLHEVLSLSQESHCFILECIIQLDYWATVNVLLLGIGHFVAKYFYNRFRALKPRLAKRLNVVSVNVEHNIWE